MIIDVPFGKVVGLASLDASRAAAPANRRPRSVMPDLDLLPIRVDPDTDRQAWGITLRLASRHRLTLSDAAYLELAMRRGLPLATLDPDLRTAATAEYVGLMAVRSFLRQGLADNGGVTELLIPYQGRPTRLATRLRRAGPAGIANPAETRAPPGNHRV